MQSQIALGKVTVFVTRENPGARHERQLLVFRHPDAGVQLPAGTIEENEDAELAALREAWEETGLAHLRIVAALDEHHEAMAPDYHMVLRRVPLLQDAHPDSAEAVASFPSYLGLRRGLPVRQIGEPKNGYSPVAYEEYDGPSHEFEAPSRRLTGWVESDALTPYIVRHFFHLTPTEPTPDAWVQNAEEWEHRFELYWVPLDVADTASIGLIPSHAFWLHTFADWLKLNA